MLRRVLPAALVAFLAADRALAGDEPVLPCPPAPPGARAQADPGARWPAALHKRNARYASLTRVDDPQGDLHERLIAHMELARVDDRLGDLEELRRKRAAGHVPPRMVAQAQVTRDLDPDGDEGEVILASITNERRFAETRRFRDLGGDHLELAIYRRDARGRMPLAGDQERIGHAAARESVTRRSFFDQRDDRMPADGTEPLTHQERELDHKSEQDDDRLFHHDQFDRFMDRDGMSDRDLDDGRDDRIERDEEDAIDKAERDLDDLDDKTDKTAEQADERQLERRTEAQNEREESNTGAGSR